MEGLGGEDHHAVPAGGDGNGEEGAHTGQGGGGVKKGERLRGSFLATDVAQCEGVVVICGRMLEIKRAGCGVVAGVGRKEGEYVFSGEHDVVDPEYFVPCSRFAFVEWLHDFVALGCEVGNPTQFPTVFAAFAFGTSGVDPALALAFWWEGTQHVLLLVVVDSG